MPLDVIEINAVTKKFCSNVKGKSKKDMLVEISGSRYYKINPDSSTSFKTRLVSKKGVFSFNKDSADANARLLENAGFVVHENCVPYLATSQASYTHKADAELRKMDNLEIRVKIGIEKRENRHVNDTMLRDEAAHLEEIRKPLLLELRLKEIKQRTVNEYKKTFTTRESIPLRDLAQGAYIVHAVRKQNTRYGDSHKLLVEVDGNKHVVWSNKKIDSTINSIPKEQMSKMLDITSGIIALPEQELATLTITGRGRNSYGHTTVYCTFDFKAKGILENRIVSQTKKECDKKEMTIVEEDHLLPYREYNNLVSLPLGSTKKISAIGYAKSYGGNRLVVQIDDTFYQAGESLEEQKNLHLSNCIIRIEKYRVKRSTRAKYAVCRVYEPGDWTAFVDYSKTEMLKKQDGSTCVVDVKTVEVKGKKRKLLLTDKGSVYKLKQSKLEESVTPGYL